MFKKIKDLYFGLNNNHAKKMRVLRYLISGTIVTIIDLSALYLFTDIFGIWYILSAILAFVIAFIVSFSLQKYWTFVDNSRENIHNQIFVYLIVTLINLGLNTLGIFIFVNYLVFHYIFAQIIVSAIIAIESYFVYNYIFNSSKV
jgi:putative flippase GtrA